MAEAQITKALALQAAAASAASQRASCLQKQQQQQQQQQPLVPIRIDVTSSQQNLRIIDTFLFDPQVWPIPLVFERHDDGNDDDDDDDAVGIHNNNNSDSKSRKKPLLMRATEDSIEANVRFLAHNVLTDAEVQGMGRTTRHFTGRADLWSISLQEVVMDQIRPQIVQIIAQNELFWNTTTTNHHHSSRKKRRLVGQPAAKKAKQTNEESMTDQPSTTGRAPSYNTLPPPSCYIPTPFEQARFQYLARAIKGSSSPSSTSSLIPIRIRMSVHGIRIHDDFLWDANLHLATRSTINSTCTNALEFARITGKDLNLPEEAIQAMAVDIVEQIHGLTMCPDTNKNSENNNVYKQELLEIIAAEKKQMANAGTTTTVGSGSGSSSSHEQQQQQQQRHKHSITAAWLLDSRKHAMDAAHLVSQHRPPVNI